MAAHGLVNGDGRPVARPTDVTVQPFKLHMRYTITGIFIKASKAQYIAQLDT